LEHQEHNASTQESTGKERGNISPEKEREKSNKKKEKYQAYLFGNIFIACPANERESKQENICSTIA